MTLDSMPTVGLTQYALQLLYETSQRFPAMPDRVYDLDDVDGNCTRLRAIPELLSCAVLCCQWDALSLPHGRRPTVPRAMGSHGDTDSGSDSDSFLTQLPNSVICQSKDNAKEHWMRWMETSAMQFQKPLNTF